MRLAVFALAVAAAAVLLLIAASMTPVFREPAGYAYPYFRVTPNGSGVAVWIEDLAGYKPNKVFWRLNNQTLGWKTPGEKIPANCGDYVEALVSYSFGQRAVAGRIACAPRFKTPSATAIQDAAYYTFDQVSDTILTGVFNLYVKADWYPSFSCSWWIGTTNGVYVTVDNNGGGYGTIWLSGGWHTVYVFTPFLAGAGAKELKINNYAESGYYYSRDDWSRIEYIRCTSEVWEGNRLLTKLQAETSAYRESLNYKLPKFANCTKTSQHFGYSAGGNLSGVVVPISCSNGQRFLYTFFLPTSKEQKEEYQRLIQSGKKPADITLNKTGDKVSARVDLGNGTSYVYNNYLQWTGIPPVVGWESRSVVYYVYVIDINNKGVSVYPFRIPVLRFVYPNATSHSGLKYVPPVEMATTNTDTITDIYLNHPIITFNAIP